MNRQPEISIIVPVYKVEEYLPCCIESVLAQSFTDFELLLIDDGSPDNCGAICEGYALKDERIRVFHQQNSGVSTARNHGLGEAKGKYVTFVDSDDWIGEDYLQNLYDALPDKISRGIVIEGVNRVYPDKRVLKMQLPGDMKLMASEVYRLLTEYSDANIGYSASKLYNLSLIKEHHICFSQELSLLEDMLFMYDYILHADFVILKNAYHYFYRTAYSHDALSVGIKSFSKEYEVFIAYQTRILLFRKRYNLPDNSLVKVLKSLKCCFHRCILSLYLPPISLRDVSIRKVFLCKLTEENKDWMVRYFFPDYKIDRITKKLMLNGNYFFCDLWMNFCLRMKCKRMYGGLL